MKNILYFIKARFITLVLLLGALILVGLKLSDFNQDENSSSIPSNSSQVYIAIETKTLVYNELGQLSHELLADKAINDAGSNTSTLTAPILFIFNDTGLPEFKVSADKALIDENKYLFLENNVKVTGLIPGTILEMLTTPSAFIDLNTQDISSHEKVNIQGKGFVSTGNGLKGNIKAQQADLLNNVKSIYYPDSAKFD